MYDTSGRFAEILTNRPRRDLAVRSGNFSTAGRDTRDAQAAKVLEEAPERRKDAFAAERRQAIEVDAAMLLILRRDFLSEQIKRFAVVQIEVVTLQWLVHDVLFSLG